MYRFIILLTISLTVTAEDEVDIIKCVSVLESEQHCCKTPLLNITTVIDDDIKECKLMPYVPGSCEKVLCFGTKLGITTADGSIQMDKLQKHVEERLADLKDVLDYIKENCYNDKYKIFGEADDCDLNKLSSCIRWQFIFKCKDFSDDEQCKEIKDIRAQCLELNLNA